LYARRARADERAALAASPSRVRKAGPAACHQDGQWHGPLESDLLFQQFQLVRLAVPLLGVGRRVFLFRDDGPLLGELCVELLEVLLAGGQLLLGEDGFGGALRLAEGAVDALVRVDG